MKLQEIQQQLKVPKNQYNSFGKYNFRNCEDILEAVKPLLGDSLLLLSDEVVNIGNHNYVKATAIFKQPILKLVEGETPENHFDIYASVTAYAREAVDQKGMNDAQITGSSSSYARKYALNGLFLIDDTKDDDTTNNHGKDESKPAKQIPKELNEPAQEEFSLDDLE